MNHFFSDQILDAKTAEQAKLESVMALFDPNGDDAEEHLAEDAKKPSAGNPNRNDDSVEKNGNNRSVNLFKVIFVVKRMIIELIKLQKYS